ncbi:MAG: DUF1002 domain-containing protein [Lachnospiraceae bacterium]|jgi:uncharacterized protein YpuA (DUF1002 family)
MNRKKLISMSLALVMTVCTPVSVLADREDATLDKPFMALGADLNAEERATVLDLLDVTEEDLADYTVVEVTNQDEHDYLGDYLSADVIGSRALSSVKVVGKEEGYGIQVSTQNISYCTVGMYQNAMATAGIEDADIQVVGPFKISGTAALVGTIKAYEDMTGEVIDPESIEAATSELVITGEVADSIGDTDKAEQLFGALKEQVVEAEDMSDDEIRELIRKTAQELDIQLTDEDIEKILSVLQKVSELDLDVDQLKDQARDIYNKLSELNIDWDSEEVQGFLARLIDAVSSFFQSLFQ